MTKRFRGDWEDYEVELLRKCRQKRKEKAKQSESVNDGTSTACQPKYIEFGRVRESISDIFMVGNTRIDIPLEKALRHPCAVVGISKPLKVIVSHGTKAGHIREHFLHRYVIINADSENGLKGKTAFLVAFIHRISYRCLFWINRIGRLSKADFNSLLSKIRL